MDGLIVITLVAGVFGYFAITGRPNPSSPITAGVGRDTNPPQQQRSGGAVSVAQPRSPRTEDSTFWAGITAGVCTLETDAGDLWPYRASGPHAHTDAMTEVGRWFFRVIEDAEGTWVCRTGRYDLDRHASQSDALTHICELAADDPPSAVFVHLADGQVHREAVFD